MMKLKKFKKILHEYNDVGRSIALACELGATDKEIVEKVLKMKIHNKRNRYDL